MRKRLVSIMLTAAMTMALLAGCSSGGTTAPAPAASTDTAASTAASAEASAPAEEASTAEAPAAGGEVLDFYHAYYHDVETWPVAEVMRSIYQDFADAHANDACTFNAIAVENVLEIATNEVAGGSFPDMVDLAGNEVPLAAIAQNLVIDLKPYIDSEGLVSKVGINYTMNDKDGHIYSVHDQLETLGLWYNADIYEAAGASTPDQWNTYDDMAAAMEAIRTYGEADGIYAYSAGQGSMRMFNTYMGILNPEYASNELTADVVNSDEFVTAFTTVANMDQANGSANAQDDVGNFSGDFNSGLCATFLNGVWAAGGFGDATGDIHAGIYPGSASLSAPGGGLTIASGLSEAQEALALEFVKYMTSDEVQERIFLEVNANPCNTDIDLTALAASSDSETVRLLAEACSLANAADHIVNTTANVWGEDVNNAIVNKLIECSVSGTDIDAKCAELQAELIGLIG
ncbi:MAG: extracellular solute-binding protein [Lachnospiraceae bacterium]|nr:extracellular solute-binding protein [Lachnospiraceae bacterium]